jgi:TorA maturation chaperone TorD
MEGREKETDPERGPTRTARMASNRATMYELLFDVFVGLTGDALLSETREGRFEELLSAEAEPYGQRVREGARLVASYRSSSKDGSPDVLADELLVDRTRLLGSAGIKGFRPPYERLYAGGPAEEGSLLQALNGFYRNAGLALDDESRESPDFLFVELDFMKQLCLREVEESLGRMPVEPTRAMERQFLRQHVGKWTEAYCIEAGMHARTALFRGFLAVLDGFIAAEIAYLGEQAPSSPEVSTT